MKKDQVKISRQYVVNSEKNAIVYRVRKLVGFIAHLVYEDGSGQSVSGGRVDVDVLMKPTASQLKNWGEFLKKNKVVKENKFADQTEVIENTGKIFFDGKGSFTEVRYEIVVEVEKGQLFKVNDCGEDSFEYKLKRVRKIFKGKEITVKKKVIQTHYYEAVIE